MLSLQLSSPSIKSIENNSDMLMNRALVHFNNGYQLSVIQGSYSYGGKSGLFEIAIFGKDGEWMPELFDNYEDGDDTVLGYQSAEDVQRYIYKIGNLS